MSAEYIEFVSAGLVPLLVAGAWWVRSASPRPIPVRSSRRMPVGAAHRNYEAARAEAAPFD